MIANESKAISVMKRYEMKYTLTAEQTAYVEDRIKEHMKVDKYGLTTIASLYYDTPDYRLIRASIEKPSYKEKIRLRSYGLASEDSPVYLELKRKSEKIVYKRRVTTTIAAVNAFFEGTGEIEGEGQIAREISYFRAYYGKLVPTCLILYDRTAYYQPDGDLRLTIDRNPRYRMTDLNLTTSLEGTPLLEEGYTVLEIKVQQAMPMWLGKILADAQIYKGSFSKYGEAYRRQAHNATHRIAV